MFSTLFSTCWQHVSTCFQHADLKLYPVDFPDFSGNLPMGSLRKSPKIGKSSGSNLHSSISWIFAQNAEWSLDPADFSIFPEICRWGAHENQKNTENRPGPTSTVGSRGATRRPKGPLKSVARRLATTQRAPKIGREAPRDDSKDA